MKNFDTVFGKTALILPPPWASLSAPLGICTIGQIFRKNKIECHIFDWNIELLHELKKKNGDAFNRQYQLYWDDIYCSAEWKDPAFFEKQSGKIITSWIEKRLNDLINNGYKTFGLSVFSSNIIVASHTIRLIRSYMPEALILAGGPATYDILEFESTKNGLTDLFYNRQEVQNKHVSEINRQNGKLLSGADYIFYTESEESLDTLLKSIIDRKNKVYIPGTAFTQSDGSIIFTPRKKEPDLALIPPINFDDLDLSLYAGKGLPVEFSRGCSGSCNFCSETWRYKPYRTRPIENLLHDFDLAGNKYNVGMISMLCSSLNGDRDHLGAFCDALILKKNNVKWNGNARLDKNLDAELLERMAKAGCKHLIFGLESASDHVLKLMNKQSNKQIASQVVEICSEIGITLTINLVVGFPGETDKDLEETLDFIRKYNKKIEYFSVHKCNVDFNATLGRYPKHFNIMTYEDRVASVDPDQPSGADPLCIMSDGPAWDNWCTTSGDNTPYIRSKRLQVVLDCLNELNKPKSAPQDDKKSDNIPLFFSE